MMQWGPHLGPAIPREVCRRFWRCFFQHGGTWKASSTPSLYYYLPGNFFFYSLAEKLFFIYPGNLFFCLENFLLFLFSRKTFILFSWGNFFYSLAGEKQGMFSPCHSNIAKNLSHTAYRKDIHIYTYYSYALCLFYV